MDWYNFGREVCLQIAILDSEKLVDQELLKLTKANLVKENIIGEEKLMVSGCLEE